MAKKRKVIFRADGNPDIGLGHVYRLLSLASRLDDTFEKRFVLQESHRQVYDLIASYSLPWTILPAHADFLAEFDGWIDRLEGDEIVVLDGYKFDGQYQKSIKDKGAYLLFLDDIHAFRYYADIVINVGTDALKKLYPHKEFYTQLYGGFAYAFLRKSFDSMARKTLSGAASDKSGVLICLGGADPDNRVVRVYEDVRRIYAGEKIHIVAGSAYRHMESLNEKMKTDLNLQVHHNVDESYMARLMDACAIGVCSASTVSYEFLTTGGQLFLYKTAENQSLIYDYLIGKGLAFSVENLGTTERARTEGLREVLLSYLGNDYNKLFHEISAQKKYTMRPANAHDIGTIFEWINEPVTRQQSTNPEPIPWENHEAWFLKKVNDENTLMLIMCDGPTAVGQIRFDVLREHILISFLVDKNHRGKGLGNLMLKNGIGYFRRHMDIHAPMVGFVRPENIASLKAFRNNGFDEENVSEGGMEMVKFTLKFH